MPSKLTAVLVASVLSITCAEASTFQVAPFSADITVPVGHPCMGGGIVPAQEIVDSLMANGVVILGAGAPLVLVGLDWCEVRNDAYDRWRDVLAEAAGTTRERVLVSSGHQHDAPVVDFAAQRMLDEVGLKNSLCDPAFVEDCIQRVAAAMKNSLTSPISVTHYGVGMAEVKEISSNRRIVYADGSVQFSRGSATKDAWIREQPIGIIDPWLKTLSFWDGDKPVAAISTYATHPMSFYGKGGVTKDFIGHARERRRADDPSVHQIYFSGCSGDVTAGKYNDGNPENRKVLADKLYNAMSAAWNNTERIPIGDIEFRCAKLSLAPRTTGDYAIDEAKRTLHNTNAAIFDRNLAAMALSWHNRVASGQAIDVPALDFGKAVFLLMPAESFVEYQLMAENLRPDCAVLVAGYGECAPGYIPTKKEFQDGFADKWLWVAPDNEEAMRQAMTEALSRD